MPKIIDYYGAAWAFVEKAFDEELESFFIESYNNSPVGFELQAQMQEWILELKKDKTNQLMARFNSSKPLVNYVWFLLSSENYTASAKPRIIYREKRRKGKKYFINTIRDEKKNGFVSGFIHDNCEKYFEYIASNPKDSSDNRYLSREEFCNAKYEQLEEWYANKKCNLISFPYIGQISDKRVAKDFFIDCAYYVYDMVENNFNGDVINGFVVKISPLSNTPIFSWNSGTENMRAEVLDNSVNVFGERVSEYNGEKTYLRTTVNQYQGNFKDAINRGVENELIESLVSQGAINLNVDILDSTDLAIFNNVYNSFSVEDVNNRVKRINLLSLVKCAYHSTKVTRRDYYENVAERVDRLSRCKIEMNVTNQSGKVVSRGNFSFWDIQYRVMSDDDNQEPLKFEYTVTDGSPNGSFKEFISSCDDLSKVDVFISPSAYIREQMLSSMNIKILKKIYSEELPPKVRAMLILLTTHRTEIFPRYQSALDYEYFISKLNIRETRKKRIRSQLEESLNYLKERKVLVQDFTMGTYAINITFIPIDDIEKLLCYNIGTPLNNMIPSESEYEEA